MKTIIAILIATVICENVFTADTTADVREAVSSVCFIEAGPNPRKGERNGSGVLIRKSGNHAYVLTAAHVLRGDSGLLSSIQVTLEPGTPRTRHVEAQPAVLDLQQDLALLRISNENVPDIPAVRSKPLGANEMIFLVGFPLAQMPVKATIFAGNPPTALDTSTEVRVDGKGYPGQSGGPVFDADGQLCGIALRGTNDSLITTIATVLPIQCLLSVKPECFRVNAIHAGGGNFELELNLPLQQLAPFAASARVMCTTERLIHAETGVMVGRQETQYVKWPTEPASSLDISEGRAHGTLRVLGDTRYDAEMSLCIQLFDAAEKRLWLIYAPMTVPFSEGAPISLDDQKKKRKRKK